MRSDDFLQFELCLLAHPGTDEERLNLIINRAADRFAQTLSSSEFETVLGEVKCPTDFRVKNAEHRRAVTAAHKLGLTLGSCEAHLREAALADEFVKRFSPKPDAFVRFKKDWVFEVREKKGISYREFYVLCALYSAIGNQPFRRVTTLEIQRRAVGCRSKELFAGGAFHAPVLTPKQIINTIAKLLTRRFFSRSCPNRREVFYSHRLSQDALEHEVFKKLEKRLHNVNIRVRDADLQARVKALKSLGNLQASNGKEKGNYNKNPNDKINLDETKKNTRGLSGKGRWLDPLKDEDVREAWQNYIAWHEPDDRVQRIRLSLIAHALRTEFLTYEEIVEALEESDSDEMHIVRICKGETLFDR